MSYYRIFNIFLSAVLLLALFSVGRAGVPDSSVAYAKGGETSTPTPGGTQPAATPDGTDLPESTSEASGERLKPQGLDPSTGSGQAASTQANCPTDVRGDWHFQGSLQDSSSYANDGVPGGSTSIYKPGAGLKDQSGIGVLGLGRNGDELPIRLANSNDSLVVSGAGCQLTLEAWVKSDDYGIGFHHIIDNLDGYALSCRNYILMFM